MLNGKFIPIHRVLEGVYRDYGFDTQLDWVDAVEWIGECLDLIGAPQTYIEKMSDGHETLNHPNPIVIEGFRGKIPCDVLHAKQCFYKNGTNLHPMRWATDSAHIGHFCKTSPDLGRDSSYTYKLNNNHIFTNFSDGEVVMVYTANPTDKDGLPLIPDEVRYVKALKAYVASKLGLRLMIQNKMDPRVLEKIEQDYYFNVGQAMVSGRIPNIDQMESWKNNFIKLVPNINTHSSGFVTDGEMERRFNNSQSR
jgi:hypothetical protein